MKRLRLNKNLSFFCAHCILSQQHLTTLLLHYYRHQAGTAKCPKRKTSVPRPAVIVANCNSYYGLLAHHRAAIYALVVATLHVMVVPVPFISVPVVMAVVALAVSVIIIPVALLVVAITLLLLLRVVAPVAIAVLLLIVPAPLSGGAACCKHGRRDKGGCD